MPARSKGARAHYTVRPPSEAAPLIEEKLRESGCSSMSQWLADLLVIAVGRPDLALELGKTLEAEVLPLAM